MVVTVEYWVSQDGDVRVTYYGPVNTYTTIVPGTVEGDQPWCADINATIEYLIGTIAPQDNNSTHDFDTVVNYV